MGYRRKESEITTIVLHCSATKPSQPCNADIIDQWHRARGWSGIGYHYVINRDGTVEKGRPLTETGAHVKGHNRNSVGICLVGGLCESGTAADNFTAQQWLALKGLLGQFKGKGVLGHRDFPYVHKDCPCFDVATKLPVIGVPVEKGVLV